MSTNKCKTNRIHVGEEHIFSYTIIAYVTSGTYCMNKTEVIFIPLAMLP